MTPAAGDVSHLARFLATLEIVRREGAHLARTDARLFARPVNAAWVQALETDEDRAERLDAFVSRFGRMQDTLGDRLLPRFLVLLAEQPGSAIDNLNRAEKLGILSSANDWRDTRELRNRLVHEYQDDPEAFALALNHAHRRIALLVVTYNAINRYGRERFGAPDIKWPAELPVT